MAVLWMDNFSNYGTSTAFMLNGLWAEVSNINGSFSLTTDPDGVSGGRVLTTTGGPTARRVFPASLTTVGFAFRVWYPALPNGADTSTVAVLSDVANASQLTFNTLTTGALEVRRGSSSGTLLGATSGPVITANAWHHIEIKSTASDTVGAVEIRVNGITVLNLTNVDTVATANVHYAQLSLDRGPGINSPGFSIKDLIAWDTSGSHNNDFLGDVKIVSIYPSSDVSFNWTASTGSTGWDLIDETSPNDTDYVSADPTQLTASVFGMTNLDPDVTSVKALQTVVRAFKTDGGDANLQVDLISNGDHDAGADRPITLAATYWFDISEVSPDTASSWTPAEVNSATISIDRTL